MPYQSPYHDLRFLFKRGSHLPDDEPYQRGVLVMASPTKPKSRKNQSSDTLVRSFLDKKAGVCAHVYLKSAGRGLQYLAVVPERRWEHGKQTRYVSDFFDYQIDALFVVAKEAREFCRRHKDNPLGALSDNDRQTHADSPLTKLAA